MCLDSCDSSYKLAPAANGVRVGYKVMKKSVYTPGYYLSPIHGGEYLRIGELTFAYIQRVYANNGDLYYSGFHIFTTLEDAIVYNARNNLSGNICLVEVEYEGIIVVGKQDGMECHVARQMRVVREVS